MKSALLTSALGLAVAADSAAPRIELNLAQMYSSAAAPSVTAHSGSSTATLRAGGAPDGAASRSVPVNTLTSVPDSSVTCAAVNAGRTSAAERATCPQPEPQGWDHHDADITSNIVQTCMTVNVQCTASTVPDRVMSTNNNNFGSPDSDRCPDDTKRGEWVIKYELCDRSGNCATPLQFSMIMDDESAPTMVIPASYTIEACDKDAYGSNPADRKFHDFTTYDQLTADDNYDGDLTSTISVVYTDPLGAVDTQDKAAVAMRTVDTEIVGAHTFAYSVHDYACMYGENGLNNPTYGSTTITVEDTLYPVITCTKAYCNEATGAPTGPVIAGATVTASNCADCCQACNAQGATRVVGSQDTPKACTAWNLVGTQCHMHSGTVTRNAAGSGMFGYAVACDNNNNWECGNDYTDYGAKCVDILKSYNDATSVDIDAISVAAAVGGPATAYSAAATTCDKKECTTTNAYSCVDCTGSACSGACTATPGNTWVAASSECCTTTTTTECATSGTYDCALGGTCHAVTDTCVCPHGTTGADCSGREVNGHFKGTHTITYECSDDHSHTTTKVRTVTVRDTTPPTLTISTAGAHLLARYTKEGEGWRHAGSLGSAADSWVLDAHTIQFNAGYLKDIAVIRNLETLGQGMQCDDSCDDVQFPTTTITTWTPTWSDTQPGTYILKYVCKDASDHQVEKTRTVISEDKTKPVIRILGKDLLTVEATLTNQYKDDGATCSDQTDGMISDKVEVSGDVVDLQVYNTNTPYYITYNCRDAAGHAAVPATRQVIVIRSTCPTCDMATTGPVELSREASFPYTDTGAVCTDPMDGATAVTGGTSQTANFVNVEMQAVYRVTYRAVNTLGLWNDGGLNGEDCAYGNKGYTRTVHVVDTLQPVISLKYNSIVVKTGKTTDVNTGVMWTNELDRPYFTTLSKPSLLDLENPANHGLSEGAGAVDVHGSPRNPQFMAETQASSTSGFAMGAAASAVTGLALLGYATRKQAVTTVPV